MELTEGHAVEQTKPCKACGEAIKAVATVCPHCHQHQSRWALSPNSPYYSIWWLALIAVMFWFFGMFPFSREITYRPGEDLTVSESKFTVATLDGYSYLTAIGTVQNNTDKAWTDIHFEARFYNQEGDLIDVINDSEYALVVGPHAQAAFRLRERAGTTGDQYSKHEIRITKAKEDRRLF